MWLSIAKARFIATEMAFEIRERRCQSTVRAAPSSVCSELGVLVKPMPRKREHNVLFA